MEENQNRRSYPCEICRGPIYCEDDTHYGDDYYLIDDLRICPDCIHEYVQSKRREVVAC